mgnify:CR=1 FL=1
MAALLGERDPIRGTEDWYDPDLFLRIDLVRAVQPAESARVENSDVARLIAYPARSYTYLAWNTKNPLFADPAVRRALSA